MSANEIANHIEAACWLRFGPSDIPGIVPPPLYFRSQSGFIDRIGVFDQNDPLATPLCYLQLDRYYTRNEVSLFAFLPTVLDTIEVPPAPPAIVVSPAIPAFEPILFPIDSRLVYGEVPAPTTVEELAGYFESFNGIFVGMQGAADGIAQFASDVCIQVVRVPRCVTGPDTVEYKTAAFFP